MSRAATSLPLIRHSLRRMRGLLLGMGLVLAGFQVLASLMAATFQENQAFARLVAFIPSSVRETLGSSVPAIMSFSGLAAIGYLHFAVIGSLIGLSIAVATEPTSEVERGFSDLVMSRPLPRSVPVTRSVALLLIAATAVNAMLLAGTWAGLALFAGTGAAWPAPRTLLSLAASLWMLMLCWGGVALGVAAGARRRGIAGVTVGLSALALYLLDVVARVWKPARGLSRFSPFHYYNPLETLTGGSLRWPDLAVLGSVAVCGIVVGYLVYGRRDL